MPDFEYEKQAINKGYALVCGVDEAGRGPLAGPVCAAAVILPTDLCIPELNDSKKLSEKKREQLFDVIKEKAISYSIAFASVEEIEELIYALEDITTDDITMDIVKKLKDNLSIGFGINFKI